MAMEGKILLREGRERQQDVERRGEEKSRGD